MKRILNPATNAPGYGIILGAAISVAVAVANAVAHHQVIDWRFVLGLAVTAWSFYTRATVTPIADPRDEHGNPLTVPAKPQP